MILKCIIVDDDPMMHTVIGEMVRKTDFLESVGTFENAIEAGNFLNKNEVDLVFLDIEMPDMSGLEFVETMVDRPQVVLITSKKEYAVQAFDLSVTDYIVKPPQYSRFLKASNKALENIKSDDDVQLKSEHLFVKADGVWVKIDISDIFLVEAKADYVTIHTNVKRYTVYSTMKGIDSKLPDDEFIRVHRSYIINTNLINSIEDNTISIGDKLIPVGVTYKERLMGKLNLL